MIPKANIGLTNGDLGAFLAGAGAIGGRGDIKLIGIDCGIAFDIEV